MRSASTDTRSGQYKLLAMIDLGELRWIDCQGEATTKDAITRATKHPGHMISLVPIKHSMVSMLCIPPPCPSCLHGPTVGLAEGLAYRDYAARIIHLLRGTKTPRRKSRPTFMHVSLDSRSLPKGAACVGDLLLPAFQPWRMISVSRKAAACSHGS